MADTPSKRNAFEGGTLFCLLCKRLFFVQYVADAGLNMQIPPLPGVIPGRFLVFVLYVKIGQELMEGAVDVEEGILQATPQVELGEGESLFTVGFC